MSHLRVVKPTDKTVEEEAKITAKNLGLIISLFLGGMLRLLIFALIVFGGYWLIQLSFPLPALSFASAFGLVVVVRQFWALQIRSQPIDLQVHLALKDESEAD